MKIREAIEKGIRRVYDPIWIEKDCYLKLPKMRKGLHGPWCHLFSEETQQILGDKTPQDVLIFNLKNGLDSEFDEYIGPISKYDTQE
jgi:hypothetical protein